MLGHKRIPSREGGVEIVVEELATRMASLGYDVTCYNRKGHHIAGKEFDTFSNSTVYKDIKLKSVFTIDKKGMAAMSSSVFAAINVAFSKYDVVHFHAEGPCAMLWLPKLFGKHCVATIHGLDHQRDKWGKLASAYIMMGEKCAAKYADEIIVLSKGVQQYFKETYERETKFIPNGVRPPVLREANLIKEMFGLEKDSYILFLGRIVPEKGIRYLLEAYKQTKTDKKLVIAGGASDTDTFMSELKRIATGDERIIFTDFVQGVILDELYSNAYLYTLPSNLEGMPLSLLEAMSYGNCCIVSDIPECIDVVENKAIVFKKANIEDLRDKLQQACDDKNMVKRYKTKNVDYICNKYNWGDVVDKTIKLYEEMVKA
ncbi:glycosyltransferase family 4 protein [Aminipila butyrica]|uniref:Glycosyltransferase family 4 protein n=2 Tax=Aminipila butyrica TaxID=433296 RepID=A0A858C0G0_9FIRM|nr:glycosyltransferase family 4 protein [Aminipila butyrica]